MKRILGSWSGMRNYLEQEMLADSLKGRVQYFCNSFRKTDGFELIEIRVDGRARKRFSWQTTAFQHYREKQKQCHDYTPRDAWIEFHKFIRLPVEEREEFTDEEFCEALKIYRSLSIQESLYHSNPIVRMFAILDRRVGKRSLLKLSQQIQKQPHWLQYFYCLRLKAEHLYLNEYPLPR
ncbi:SF0329 family protein [Clostridium facile]|uniref:Uncharacterized protein n=1 Tax=Clostridium facile TaxID=2763035 RepID=A0ABR7IP97_9CLOT|nr:hypothetical protein [Clostridium facile]MBC5786961.1 hypothetical protein [Clostridium facile]